MRRDPVIVPFYHSGMARIMPEHGRIPRVGQTVAVTVGEPIDVSDLTCQCREVGNTQVVLLPCIAQSSWPQVCPTLL